MAVLIWVIKSYGKTIVIVGGVAGGASAAARLRRLNEYDNIIILERGEYISLPTVACLIISAVLLQKEISF